MKQAKFDIQWNEKFSLLKEFRKEFGHCNVPQYYNKNISLGRWVIRQRVRKNKLSSERMKKLNEIGFVWNIYEYTWQKHYKELLLFKEKFGHCNVSRGNEEYLALANWIIKQRQNLKNNKLSKICEGMLNEIGFVWEEYKRTPWEKNFEKLEEYKSIYGDCNVPRNWKNDPPLSYWVSIQRRERNKLSPEQKMKLETIGFQWKLKPGRKLLSLQKI